GGGDNVATEKDLVDKMRAQQTAVGGITEPDLEVPPIHVLEIRETMPPDDDDDEHEHVSTPMEPPSVTVSGTREENSGAVRAAAAFADRDRLLAAHREAPDDPGILLALLAH